MAETITSPLGKAHPNATRIEALYASIRDHDAESAALCYRADAHFEDIAFLLDGRERIRQMWQLVCSREVQVSFDSIAADDREGSGHWVARYTFGDTGAPSLATSSRSSPSKAASFRTTEIEQAPWRGPAKRSRSRRAVSWAWSAPSGDTKPRKSSPIFGVMTLLTRVTTPREKADE